MYAKLDPTFNINKETKMKPIEFFYSELRHLPTEPFDIQTQIVIEAILESNSDELWNTLVDLYWFFHENKSLSEQELKDRLPQESRFDFEYAKELLALPWVEMRTAIVTAYRAQREIPLSPIEGHEDEWVEISDEPSYLSNRRLPSLRKVKETGEIKIISHTRTVKTEAGVLHSLHIQYSTSLPFTARYGKPIEVRYLDFSYRLPVDRPLHKPNPVTPPFEPQCELFTKPQAEKLNMILKEITTNYASNYIQGTLWEDFKTMENPPVRVEEITPVEKWAIAAALSQITFDADDGEFIVVPVLMWDWVTLDWVASVHYAIRWVDGYVYHDNVYVVYDAACEKYMFLHEYHAGRYKENTCNMMTQFNKLSIK